MRYEKTTRKGSERSETALIDTRVDVGNEVYILDEDGRGFYWLNKNHMCRDFVRWGCLANISIVEFK